MRHLHDLYGLATFFQIVNFSRRSEPLVASLAHAREGVALETESSDHCAERAFPQLFCAVSVSQLDARATSCIRELAVCVQELTRARGH